MIKRFPTQCNECGNYNTLRIVLGTDRLQSHTFLCAGCGQPSTIKLEIDFINRDVVVATEKGNFTAPSIVDVTLDNSVLSETEGAITNLDPTFLIPEEYLHQDAVFPWMMGANPRPDLPALKPDGPRFFDIIDELSIPRGMREVLSATLKLVDLDRRDRNDLVQPHIETIAANTGIKVKSPSQAIALVLSGLIGKNNHPSLQGCCEQADLAQALNPEEFSRMRNWMRKSRYREFFDRQLLLLKDHLKGYDQLNQTWVYAAHGEMPNEELAASTRDLDKVQYFYGNAFEQLASGLALPACINNIIQGRSFDEFERMSLEQYITIDKGGRARCLENNPEFSPLYVEFDSSLRNGSHHRGLRIKPGRNHIVQFRTGDHHDWKEIRYVEYLWRCNRILMCALHLLGLQIYVLGLNTGESN